MIAKTESALDRARREAHEACPHKCVNHSEAFDNPDRGWQWLTGCDTCGLQHAKIAYLEAVTSKEGRKEAQNSQPKYPDFENLVFTCPHGAVWCGVCIAEKTAWFWARR